MIRRLILLALMLAPGAVRASEDQPLPPVPRQLTQEELRAEVPDSTISGRHFNGMPFSEYHLPDGRVFGHNNHDPVQDGCWRIVNDEVCYYYEGGIIQGQFCWKFYRAPGGYTIFNAHSGTLGSAKREAGNPRNWSDRGKPWLCDGAVSMR